MARPEVPVLFALNTSAADFWNHPDAPCPEPLRDNFDAFRSLTPPEPLPPLAEPKGVFHFAATYQIESTRFQLRLTSDELVKELAPRLADLRISDRDGPKPAEDTFTLQNQADGAVDIYLNGRLLAQEDLLAGARALLLQEVTRLAVPNRSFGAILHAGACGDSERCLILAGPSFSGKSTLCAELMATGFTCYSDDSACLTADYRLAGMPFSLALREGDRFRPSNLNGRSPLATPAALLFVNYQPTASTTLTPLTPFEAFHELQRSGFWVDHTESSITAFLRWLSHIPTHKITYSESPIPTVRALLNATPPPENIATSP